MKLCIKCQLEKPLDQFHKYKTPHSSGIMGKCKVCHYKYGKENAFKYREKKNLQAKEYKKRTKEQSHRYKLKSRYNLTLENFNKIREEQNYSCYICKEHESKSKHEQLHVDHCHRTGKVRGLLCHFCNVGLGKFKDNPEFLQAASEYLKKNG